MILIGYKLGSKGYQFWDAANQHFKISCDVKFKETLFPAKEVTMTKLSWASLNDPPISESDNKSDHSGLDLVIPDHPSPRPPSPGQSALRHTVQKPQMQTHPNPPLPHQWFHRAHNLLYQAKDLLCLNLPHHNIPFVLLRIN